MTNFEKANTLLNEFKGDSYLYGDGVLNDVGKVVAVEGKKAVLVSDNFSGSRQYIDTIRQSLNNNDVNLTGECTGARPNAPLEDMYRIANDIENLNPDVIISFGGGSTIDAVKAADVVRILGGKIDDYFGMGLVSEALKKSNRALTPHVAIQTAASSAAHLTKYSNITDISTGQKKLIVDEAIVPSRPVFDHKITYSSPLDLTLDGALDGIAHSLEVLNSAAGTPGYEKIEQVASACIGLVVEYLPRVIKNPKDKEAREAICLATDLGGYAIMLGGTNGGHLTSFSLVDILSHGRACSLMNPYYTVFFAPAIETPLRMVGEIFQEAGYTMADLNNLSGRELGEAVALAMFSLANEIGFPTTLNEIEGFSREHIERALKAAMNPQLKMKLQNMPVSLSAETVNEYMKPVLEAAKVGDLSLIKNVDLTQ